ncbi:hypothetical protein BS47DRAFT_1321719, partial [Hydnum rufescens UP504]
MRTSNGWHGDRRKRQGGGPLHNKRGPRGRLIATVGSPKWCIRESSPLLSSSCKYLPSKTERQRDKRKISNWGRTIPSSMRVVHRALRSVHSQSTRLVRPLSMTNSMVASNGLSPFEFTSSRWLFDEDTHLAARRVSFDVEALKAVACEAVQASRCTSFTKVAEGFYNKIYTLKFETGPEVIARVPHPIAGPPRYIIASEVATMDYLRNILDIPVPRVLAWSAS